MASKGTKSNLDIPCVDKVSAASGAEYLINPNTFDIFFHSASLRVNGALR